MCLYSQRPFPLADKNVIYYYFITFDFSVLSTNLAPLLQTVLYIHEFKTWLHGYVNGIVHTIKGMQQCLHVKSQKFEFISYHLDCEIYY